MNILVTNKLKLTKWLSSDRHILQHAQADEIIDDRVYRKLKHITQPEDLCIELIDTAIGGGERSSFQFLTFLRKTEIVDTYPQLKEWNASFALPGKEIHKKYSLFTDYCNSV